MRYHLLTTDEDLAPIETAVTGLERAVALLRRHGGASEDASHEATQSVMRWLAVETGHQPQLWAELGEGAWLSLDPEDAMDAMSSREAMAAFEAGISAPETSSITYRLRMIDPDGAYTITDHARLASVFEAISGAWRYHMPPGPGYAWGLWRTEAEPSDLALSARAGSGAAAVPLAISRAETAFASSHAALALEKELRDAFVRRDP